MNETDNRPAVVGQVEPTVRPAAWMLRHLLDPQQKPWPTRADSDAYKLAAGRSDFECTPLYDQTALDAAVAAERKRCAAVARRWGETHADGETVNARNAASKIARGIEGPNAK